LSSRHSDAARGKTSETPFMFPILEADYLAPDIKRFVVEAARVARKR
jgi:hypothetical protein